MQWSNLRGAQFCGHFEGIPLGLRWVSGRSCWRSCLNCGRRADPGAGTGLRCHVSRLRGVLPSGGAVSFLVRERGRVTEYAHGCQVFFEVTEADVDTPTSLEVYALGHRGQVLGHGTHYGGPYPVGMLFDVSLSDVSPDLVLQWQVQGKTGHPAQLISCLVDADSAPGELSSRDRVNAEGAGHSLKNDYQGEVHGNRRTLLFHHPACSAAKAMDDACRRIFSSPAKAMQSDMRPCFSCLWNLTGVPDNREGNLADP